MGSGDDTARGPRLHAYDRDDEQLDCVSTAAAPVVEHGEAMAEWLNDEGWGGSHIRELEQAAASFPTIGR